MKRPGGVNGTSVAYTLVLSGSAKKIAIIIKHDFFEIDNADRIHKANMYVIQAKKLSLIHI